MSDSSKIEDVQGQADQRGVMIEQVGISEVKLPMVVQDRERGRQQVTATIRISASLSPAERGTHMSRFVELLDRFKSRPLNPEILEVLLESVVDRLGAERSYLDVSFLYFRTKRSPLTAEPALMGYACRLGGDCEKNGEKKFRKIVEADVPILTLCPCSKAISEFGAHNQRTQVKAAVEMAETIWIEELIDLVESEGSSEVYPLLKRPDEKFVTEASYRNPKFVEDVVRDIALKFDADPRVASYRIECESLESIHSHNAYAIISSGPFPCYWR
ncbi:MAG: GTP cyclohydrolase [Candidatus Lindowbacteria bacterium RIFCSPLOWO2_12_FULL_62_27]|nr:MAG: GTP cyclohydrolase [Candidatus Lindowbacteria bacterium RIFCSPLOWO2_12_FULL_62_27]OGH62838.1 MAG: GTP cyclohydrolase [Candidatus Lindowbacteria bacterium RIFCSPLOWO2_02_FULL_62_12]